MATINVKDASGSTVAIEKPLTPGRAAAASSRPVALSTEDAAKLDLIATDIVALQAAVAGVAHDAAASAVDPVLVGGFASAAAPSDVSADTDAVRAWLLRNGSQVVQIAAAGALIPGDATHGANVQHNSGSVASGAFAAGSIAAGAVAAGASSFVKLEDVASADADAGVPVLAVRKATPANTSGTDGDYEFLQISGGYAWFHDNKGLANLAFSAAFTTLTRPANTTAYTALDSISDNATAGSVTALTATIADVNDDPMFLSEILIKSTDTGLAGKRIRAYLFNSDPTASTGVAAGDNVAYSQKVAGYIGSMSGYLETGFSDGTVGRLVPSFADGATTMHASAGGFIVTKPTSGAKTLFIQYQAVDGFTPSGSSTTIIGTIRGWQARAV